MIICGGRGYVERPGDYEYVAAKVNQLPITTIISGGASGADTMAIKFARKLGIDYKVFYAEWAKHGRSAGYRRNLLMAQNADAVIAFPGGKGTANMVSIAKQMGLTVYKVHDESTERRS